MTHAAHLALVDAGGARELVERQRLARRAEQRDGAPLPQADAELAAVAQLGAARQQVRDRVQPVRDQLADDASVIEERRLALAAQADVEAVDGRPALFAIRAFYGVWTEFETGSVDVLEKHASSAAGASGPNTAPGN